MKKIFCCLCLIMFLCGCGKNKAMDTDISTKNLQVEEKDDGDISVQKQSGGFINCYQVVKDEENGTTKEGLILENLLEYDDSKINLGVSITFFFDESYEQIPVLMMLVLDDRLIPFSMSGKEEDLFHEFVIESNKEYYTYIDFLPIGVSNIEEKNISVVVIPFYNKSEITIGENDILKHTMRIISQKESIEAESYNLSDDYFIADMTTVYQKELHEISKYNKIVTDYLLFDAEGSFYYSGDYLAGEYVTFLFCDGKLYPGFNGEAYFLWEKEDDNFVHHKIDLEDLEKGKHIFFTVTFERNTDKCRAKKSMNCEVQIDE